MQKLHEDDNVVIKRPMYDTIFTGKIVPDKQLRVGQTGIITFIEVKPWPLATQYHVQFSDGSEDVYPSTYLRLLQR